LSGLRFAAGGPVKFKFPLVKGEFVQRYKRFFADVKLDSGDTVVAHVPNTGSLKTCLFAGSPCLVSETDDPNRKLKATLHFVKTPTSWVGVDTTLPNFMVHRAWEAGHIEDWKGFAHGQREYKISKESRLDLVLARDADALKNRKYLHHIEVKNVTYAVDGVARFPDAVTERGQKHLRDLMMLRDSGHGAEIVFVIQRSDCTSFGPADEIDPKYGRLLREAAGRGVRVRALACRIDPATGISLLPDELPLIL
jgi:sugar fermentation stimulation protein A